MDIGKRFAVLILFFEKARQTIACVKSFLPSGVPIYILNNGSSERNSRAVERFCAPLKQVTIFTSGVNLGVSGGRNFLIEKTGEELLFFVDNDIVIKTDNWVDTALAAIAEHPDAEVFIPRIFNVWEKRCMPYFSMEIIDNKMVFRFMEPSECAPGMRVNCFPGGASIVRRGLFERLGLYDSGMFVGFEDYEMAIRGIRTQPVAAVTLQSVTLHHDHAAGRFVRRDRKAAAVRYAMAAHEDSVRRIQVLHGVEFSNSRAWRKWVLEQQRVMSPGIHLLEKLAAGVKKIKARMCPR